VGVWNRDDRPADAALLARMAGALAHRGPDGAGSRVAGAFGLAVQHLWVTPEEQGETQPLMGPDGLLVALDGRLDNRDELVAQLDLGDAASDAACARAAYARWQDGAIARLSGDFALAILAPSQRRLVLARDPIGLRPLYYHEGSRHLAFASEIKALLRHPEIAAEPDDEGVADCLLLGARSAGGYERTCFAGVRALPPAHLLVADARGCVVRSYWEFDPTHRIVLPAFEQYAEAFHERFAAAVRRRIRSAYPVALSVSGGLDSSSILSQAEVLRRAGAVRCPGLVPITYTGVEGSAADEQAYVAELERHFGMTAVRLPLPAHVGVAARVREQVWHAESPMVDGLWGMTRRVLEEASARGARRFLTGHWGDQMLYSSAYLVDLARRLAWRDLVGHMRELGRWFGAIERRDIRRHFFEDALRYLTPGWALPALKRLRRRLPGQVRTPTWMDATFRRRMLRGSLRPAAFGAPFGTAQARSLYVEARARYHVQCMEWNNKLAGLLQLDAAFPFLDRDVIAFLMATPGEIHNWQGVPRALMRAAMRDVLPAAIRQRSWKADFSDVVNAGVHGDLAAVGELFDAGALSVQHGYVDPKRLERERARVAEGLAGDDCLASWEVTDVLGLESWLRVFFGASRTGPEGAGGGTR
jgi:asparagine synthase (glutamine-hydrolysing)